MNLFGFIWSILSAKQKFVLIVSMLMRVVFVSLDLVGILLVGAVVSLASNTTISNTSLMHSFLTILSGLGIESPTIFLASSSIFFFILKGALSISLNFWTSSYLGRLESEVSSRIFSAVLESDLDAKERLKIPEFLVGVSTSVNSLVSQLIAITSAIVGELALLLGISVFLAVTNIWLFAMTAAFFGAVGAFLEKGIGRSASKASAAYHESILATQNLTVSSLANFKVIAASGRARRFSEAFEAVRSSAARANSVQVSLAMTPRYVIEAAVMLGIGLLLLQQLLQSEAGVPNTVIAIFLAGVFRIVSSMIPLQSGITSVRKIQYDALPAINLYRSFVTSKNEVGASALAPRAAEEPPKLRIQALSYKSADAEYELISNLSIDVPACAYLAVTGPSGSGKTTLADVLLGLRQPTRGSVEIDGMTPQDYRSKRQGIVGYVPQNVDIFPGTLYENIVMQFNAIPEISEDLTFAVEHSALAQVIDGLPEGLGTKLGAGGVELSGGQAQRVGLARALYTRPKLLVLDEATSGLDQETENNISDAIREVAKFATCIVIAHRPETLKAATMQLALVGPALR